MSTYCKDNHEYLQSLLHTGHKLKCPVCKKGLAGTKARNRRYKIATTDFERQVDTLEEAKRIFDNWRKEDWNVYFYEKNKLLFAFVLGEFHNTKGDKIV